MTSSALAHYVLIRHFLSQTVLGGLVKRYAGVIYVAQDMKVKVSVSEGIAYVGSTVSPLSLPNRFERHLIQRASPQH